MDEIIINSGEYFGPIIKFSINCVTSISITPESNWVEFKLPPDKDDNVVNMHVYANTGSEREETFTVKYSINKGDKTESCTDKQFKIKQKAKVDTCSKFIVDGGSWDDVPSTGDTTCDSAFLLVDGKPQFTPVSAASWVTINKYYWDTDGPSMMCANYEDYPCVANDLMRDAGIVNNDISCKDIPTPTMADMPEVVRTAITGNNEYTHALGTVRYSIAQNNEGVDRTCTIRWIVDSKECPSRDFTITQLGGSTPPTPTCDCNDLKVSGDKEINSNKQDNIKIGSFTARCVTNITVSESADWITRISADTSGNIIASVNENTGTTNTRATEITVKGMARTVECEKSFTLTQNPKSETCTKCSDVNIQNLNDKTVEASGSVTEAIEIGSFSFDCSPDAGFKAKKTEGEDDFVSNITITKDETANECKIYGVVAENTETTEKTEKIGVFIGDSTSSCESYTITQQGATPTTCDCNSITITQPSSGFTIPNNGNAVEIGSIENGCEVGFTGASWITISVEGSKIMASADALGTTEPRIGGGYIGIKGANGTSLSCKEIQITQLGLPTTYDITVYCTYESSNEGVTPYVRYEGITTPGSRYFNISNGTVNMLYFNCIGTTASPDNWPSGTLINYCEPGQGSSQNISRDSIPTTRVVTCTVKYGPNEASQSSNDEVKEYTYLNFTYRVTVKTNK